MAGSRKYYTQFCHKFANALIPKYINTLYRCRPTVQDGTIMGCEQLLLDTHSLKTVLLDLPSIGSQVQRKAPASYTKVVVKGMTKAEMIVKVVMASVTPSTSFVEQYLKLLPDSTLTEFHKVLDMKGVRRVDQVQLVDLFKRMAPKENLAANDHYQYARQSSTLKSTTDSTESSTVDPAERGHIRKLENMIKKRLPN